jgi:hypothetical protein
MMRRVQNISQSMMPVDSHHVPRVLQHFQQNLRFHIPPLARPNHPWGAAYKPLPEIEESTPTFAVEKNGCRLIQHSRQYGGVSAAYSEDVTGGDIILICVRDSRNSTVWQCFAARHWELSDLHLFPASNN